MTTVERLLALLASGLLTSCAAGTTQVGPAPSTMPVRDAATKVEENVHQFRKSNKETEDSVKAGVGLLDQAEEALTRLLNRYE